MRGVTDLSRFFIYMKEIWKNVLGYEGLYEVSNLGRVRKYRGKLIRMNKNYQVTLIKDKIGSSLLVRRLVADAFIENTLDMPYVINLDGNNMNNELSNLEWSDKIQPYRKKLCERYIGYIKENPENLSVAELASMFRVNERTIKMYLNENT